MDASQQQIDLREYADRLEFLCRAQKAEIAKLRGEIELLQSNAHGTLKSIYADGNQPASLRVRAATAALGHESPPLKSVEPALELTAEPYEDLATVVARQRARADRILALPLEERERLVRGVVRHEGNGQDDSSGD
jgi:hypothetical protein